MSKRTEDELVFMAVQGDQDAFDSLVVLFMPRIYRLCFKLVGQQQDAEDCTQEAFLKAYRSLASYRSQSSFYTWLYRIAQNVCHDHFRSRHHKMTLSLDQIPNDYDQPLEIKDEGLLPDDLAISHELGRQLAQHINTLTEPMRDVLVLRDLEGYSYDAIASMLQISEGTVKSRLFRARNQIMNKMNREQTTSQLRQNDQQSRREEAVR